ncbi:MAG: DUF3127 domain-containing protein [Bacteroidetes bacterium]|nr:DUF3127 domain-containing protein [Bacteroidota bacterium]
MELTGKLIKILPLQTGTGKNGVWKKQEFVVETAGQITRKVCFSLWGEKIDQARLSEGEQFEISFDLESREYNGRWYTEAKAWKAVRKEKSSSAQEVPPPDYTDGPNIMPADDLPF